MVPRIKASKTYVGTGVGSFSEGTMAMFTRELFTVCLLSNLIAGQSLLCYLLHLGGTVWNHYVDPRSQTRMKERKEKNPPENNQSTPIFQLVSFHLVTLLFCVCGSWLMTRMWRNTLGDRLDAWAAPEIPQLRPCRGRRDKLLHPFTSDHCLFGTLQEVTTGSDCGCQQNCECAALNCWQIGPVLSQWRAMMDWSPPLYKVLKLFFMDSLLHLHLIYCVSLVLFCVCVLACVCVCAHVCHISL